MKRAEIRNALTQLINLNKNQEDKAKAKRNIRQRWFYVGKQMMVKDIAELLKINLY